MRIGLLLVLWLALSAPARAAETLASLPNESWIRSLGDLHLVQVQTEHGYELHLIEDGELGELYPIDASRYPMDADLGTLRQGEPAVVFSRCSDSERRRCDLFLYPIPAPEPVKLRGANTRAAETAPTLWQGRLAWVRDRRVAMTRRIGSRGRSREVRVAPRFPGLSIQALELEGRHLAVDLVYLVVQWEVQGRDVRLVDLANHRRRVLAHGEAGNQGQDYKGLSFSGGWFGWHRSCWELECDGMAYRYRLRDAARQRAEVPNFAGFSLDRGGYLGITAGERIDNDGCSPEPACSVVREPRVAWRRG